MVVNVDAFIVGPTVMYSARHSRDRRTFYWPRLSIMKNACDATHEKIVSPCRRFEKGCRREG